MSREEDIKRKQEVEKLAFQTDLGQKARVERTSVEGEAIAECNRLLKAIGQVIQDEDATLSKTAKYMGSCAIHYYLTEGLNYPIYVSQASTIDGVPEYMVQAGITDLRNELIQRYGHKPQRKRSGF